MKKIGIIVAMQKELDLFIHNLTNVTQKTINTNHFFCGSYKDMELVAVVSGIGKVCSSLTTANLINHFSPDLIINIGISGGLDSSLNIGDFVIGASITYHDVWCGEPNEYGQIQGLPSKYHSDDNLIAQLSQIKNGLICSGDKFITDKTELMSIKKQFPQALAVDMESCSIAQTCYIYNVPLLCIRQISDTPGVEHHAEQYNQFWVNVANQSSTIIQQILQKL